MPSSVPPTYTRQNNFVADATNNPGITVPGIASDLDAEYEAIRTSLNQTISRLSEIQRDDGKLRSNVLDPAEYTAINAAMSGASAAQASATAAAASAASASSSATTASTNATTATNAANDALGHRNLAQAAATAAAASQTNALSSSNNANAKATQAANSATAAQTSASGASASAVTASTKATEASASAASAATSAATATTKASEASASAASALASQTAAASSLSTVQASATAAATSAANAADSAVSAANSASVATNKAHEANVSATDAEASKLTVQQAEASIALKEQEITTAANAALDRWDDFDSRYLGAFASAPTQDGNGDPLNIGASYFNTTANEMRVWDGTIWLAQFINQNSTVSSFNNRVGTVSLLASDVASVATGAASTVLTANLTSSRALVSSSFGKIAVSGVTSSELGHLSGVTSAVQTQLNAKENTITGGTTAQYWRGDKTFVDFFASVRVATLMGLSTATNAIISATDSVLDAFGKLQGQITANLATLTAHTGNTSNPHATTKAQVGLGNVDNTSDLAKPISTATQTALNAKLSSVSFAVNTFTGNGTTSAYTLTASAVLNATNVFINGVYQHKNTYTVSGTILTFSEAPPSGAAIDVNILQTAI